MSNTGITLEWRMSDHFLKNLENKRYNLLCKL